MMRSSPGPFVRAPESSVGGPAPCVAAPGRCAAGAGSTTDPRLTRKNLLRSSRPGTFTPQRAGVRWYDALLHDEALSPTF